MTGDPTTRLKGMVSSARESVLGVTRPRARHLLGAALAVMVVASVLPWTVSGVGYSTTFAGDLSSVGFGGHRLYLLLDALLGATALAPTGNRRRIAMISAYATLVTTAFVFYKLWKSGG